MLINAKKIVCLCCHQQSNFFFKHSELSYTFCFRTFYLRIQGCKVSHLLSIIQKFKRLKYFNIWNIQCIFNICTMLYVYKYRSLNLFNLFFFSLCHMKAWIVSVLWIIVYNISRNLPSKWFNKLKGKKFSEFQLQLRYVEIVIISPKQ